MEFINKNLKDMGDVWIGVDLDGTLAILDKDVSPTHIGEPIPIMVNRVKSWHKQGKRIKIFTARVSPTFANAVGLMKARGIIPAIKVWCHKHLGFVPEITYEKDHLMVELWDDIKLVNVKRNTGEISWDDYIKRIE